MKKILLTALVLTAFTAAQAHSVKTEKSSTTPPAKSNHKSSKAHTGNATAGSKDNSANYIGTNDFNLALVREGVRMG